jgi:hypothetical protein
VLQLTHFGSRNERQSQKNRSTQNIGAKSTWQETQHGKPCFIPKFYLSLHFSLEWVGETKNFKVYNVHWVHTFDKENNNFTPTYHIDSMFLPVFAEGKHG